MAAEISRLRCSIRRRTYLCLSLPTLSVGPEIFFALTNILLFEGLRCADALVSHKTGLQFVLLIPLQVSGHDVPKKQDGESNAFVPTV